MLKTILKNLAIVRYFSSVLCFYLAIKYSISISHYLTDFHIFSISVSPWNFLYHWIFEKANPYRLAIFSGILVTAIFLIPGHFKINEKVKNGLSNLIKGAELLYLALFFDEMFLFWKDSLIFLTVWWLAFVYRFLLLDVLYQKPNQVPGDYHPYWK